MGFRDKFLAEIPEKEKKVSDPTPDIPEIRQPTIIIPEKKFRAAKEGDLYQIIIDITQERVPCDPIIIEYFKKNTNAGVFRGKGKGGGRGNSLIMKTIQALVDSKMVFIKVE